MMLALDHNADSAGLFCQPQKSISQKLYCHRLRLRSKLASMKLIF